MRILPKIFLDMFPNRVLNVHPADLSVKDMETGKRLFTGSDAVEKAYNASVKQMRSTIHFVNEEVDGGPICYVSPPHETDYTLSSAENQNIMKDVCDGPAGQEALRMFYTGKITLGETKRR
jgi:folate-dependent phosphoribosylglycinamide formyltransferase PurN